MTVTAASLCFCGGLLENMANALLGHWEMDGSMDGSKGVGAVLRSPGALSTQLTKSLPHTFPPRSQQLPELALASMSSNLFNSKRPNGNKWELITCAVLPSLSQWIGEAQAIIPHAVSHLQMPRSYHVQPVLPWEALSFINLFLMVGGTTGKPAQKSYIETFWQKLYHRASKWQW